jgi:predicted DNA-binding protein (MmcQ/YjbR family)
MNLEEIRDFCLQLKGVTEEFPFGPETIVYKVKGKVFLLTSLDSEELSFNVKCEPELAAELREQYPSVLPGYHMNKKHWNTVKVDGRVSEKLLYQWIRNSYELVVAALPKKQRDDF